MEVQLPGSSLILSYPLQRVHIKRSVFIGTKYGILLLEISTITTCEYHEDSSSA